MNDGKCLVHKVVRMKENTQVSALYIQWHFKKAVWLEEYGWMGWTGSDEWIQWPSR